MCFTAEYIFFCNEINITHVADENSDIKLYYLLPKYIFSFIF